MKKLVIALGISCFSFGAYAQNCGEEVVAEAEVTIADEPGSASEEPVPQQDGDSGCGCGKKGKGGT
jgi:hypothetical protein